MVQIDALHEKEDYHILATLYQAGNEAFFRTGALRLSCYQSPMIGCNSLSKGTKSALSSLI